MKISELIQKLEEAQVVNEDLDVWCFGMDKYGYANNECEFDVAVCTKKELRIGDQDTCILFIG